MPVALVWFRQDLRLSDNAALARALARGWELVPVYIESAEGEPWAPGAASRWWLHHALQDLDAQLRAHGSRLILRRGPAAEALEGLIEETGAEAVYWNRRYEPANRERDGTIKEQLRGRGLEAASENSSLLYEPHTVENKSGQPYKVFSQFFRTVKARALPAPTEVDLGQLKAPDKWPRSDALEALELLPKIRWDSGLAEAWDPTRAGAERLLQRFTAQAMANYGDDRNRPDIEGTSRLSPYLHFGQIGPREIAAAMGDLHARGASKYFSEICWREFAHHVLYHFPDTPEEPLRPEFEDFPWRSDKGLLERWQKGLTGYPIVDAAMRELWQTGWMHNRCRMVVASLLVKHLLQPWQDGARWFWDTLVDADLANNTLGWQWTAGCGADAAPYFRIFNPMIQGAKFDPEGSYVRRYVPELAKLPTKYLHAPWEADEETLRAAGVTLGRDYPRPLIGHTEGRDRALSAFEQIKKTT